jgi:hypothetical protein
LQIADLFAEGLEVGFGQGRERAKRDPPVKLLGRALRKIRKRGESRRLAFPGEPLRARVEDQKHTPIGREGKAADEGRQGALVRAAVEHGAAQCEGGDADS